MLSSLRAALNPPASRRTACHRLLCATCCSLPVPDCDECAFAWVGVTDRISAGGGGGGATNGLVAIKLLSYDDNYIVKNRDLPSSQLGTVFSLFSDSRLPDRRVLKSLAFKSSSTTASSRSLVFVLGLSFP